MRQWGSKTQHTENRIRDYQSKTGNRNQETQTWKGDTADSGGEHWAHEQTRKHNWLDVTRGTHGRCKTQDLKINKVEPETNRNQEYWSSKTRLRNGTLLLWRPDHCWSWTGQVVKKMDGFTLYVTFLFSLVCFDWSMSSINSYCIEIISLLFHSFLPEVGLGYVSLPYLTFLLTLRLLPEQGSASLTLNLHDHKGGFFELH